MNKPRKMAGKSPREIIRDYAAQMGICTRCTCQWSITGNTLCARCFAYTAKASKSLANVIMRENNI